MRLHRIVAHRGGSAAGMFALIVRIALFLGASGLAGAAPLGADAARHLLVRTTFSASSSDIRAYADLTREEAADRLLATVRTEPATQPRAELDQWTPRSQVRALPELERREWLRQTIQHGQELRGWWFAEMLATPSPFTERMTLFWHNHFVSSLRKVRPTRLMYRQNLLLRKHAFGNFREMLHAVTRDPAMIMYLDNASNRKGQPNENFAREVMELFTLGEGNYGEQDVKEAARAFTGWGIDGESGEFLFRPALHDGEAKTVLGRHGFLDGGDVLDILLARPQTAEHIVRKLWREFVSPQPDDADVRRVAAEFRRSGYEIRVVMRALLTADAFYAEANRASLVKSPVDLLVGTLRQFAFEVADAYPFVVMARRLGQDLLAPPNVKGWTGGESWINAGTLLARKQAMERLFRAAEPSMQAMSGERTTPADAAQAGGQPGNPLQPAVQGRFQRAMQEVRFDPVGWGAQYPAGSGHELLRTLLPIAPAGNVDLEQDRLALLRQITLDPVYQLK